MVDPPPEAKFAIDTVREASQLARRIQREMVGDGITKSDRSPVTVADFAIQALVARRLSEHLPGSILIGEEQSDVLQFEEGIATLDQVTDFVRTAIPDSTPEEVCGLIDRGAGEPTDTFWTLDPVDGTKGFLRREQYAVALALIQKGQVELGVLGCPELSASFESGPNGGGMLIAALRDHGTWAQPLPGGNTWQRLHVSSRSQAAASKLLRSVEKAHTNTDELGQLHATLKIAQPTVAMDSQAKYAVLAAGMGDILVRLLSPSRPDYREKIWDQAAGTIVVTESGGRVTDLDGRPLEFTHGRTLAKNRGVLATNGHLHDAVLSGLRAIGA
jgi:3'(2'), 5'-bisphosphate nucleotidase